MTSRPGRRSTTTSRPGPPTAPGTNCWRPCGRDHASTPGGGRRESACCIDSQSVKSACGGQAIGTDGAKKVKGRKRHIVTDTLGLLPAVAVTAANADDGTTAPGVMDKVPEPECRRLQKVFADGKYHNATFEAYLAGRGLGLEISSMPAGAKEFKPLKIRWVVEQSFGCMGRWRRLSRDYERTTRSSEAMVKISAVHRLPRRIKPGKKPQVFHYKRPQRSTKTALKH